MRNVGWMSVWAAICSEVDDELWPAPDGGSNNRRPPTCIGCSRDSPMKKIASVGDINCIASFLPAWRRADARDGSGADEPLPVGVESAADVPDVQAEIVGVVADAAVPAAGMLDPEPRHRIARRGRQGGWPASS